ncbi:hypothetical protein Pcinc_015871 [Petrolisthes cinctipes]|uniref:Uncharacterized protein n=1 Tax=Petrolisthes cinctipes TaxID=88211 RepID=A0AAE1FS73_PETCI|nr:hypothetical protein Pcinc_015871 [Petrolisthes cinctipes]
MLCCTTHDNNATFSAPRRNAPHHSAPLPASLRHSHAPSDPKHHPTHHPGQSHYATLMPLATVPATRYATPMPLAAPHIILRPCPSRNTTPTPLATAHTTLPLYPLRNTTPTPLATWHIVLHPCLPCNATLTPPLLPCPRNRRTITHHDGTQPTCTPTGPQPLSQTLEDLESEDTFLLDTGSEEPQFPPKTAATPHLQ